MTWVAIRMLIGATGRYLSMIAAMGIATFLIAQQSSIFCGVMLQTAGQIRNAEDAEIWVMDPDVHFSDELLRLPDSQLLRTRGVAGVEWAVPQASVLVEARAASGSEYRLILIGLDDTSLVGVPRTFVAGSAEGLAAPDAVIIDEATYRRFWPGEPLCTGRLLELNEQRAVVQGVFRSGPTFQVYPIAYARYSSTTTFAPAIRRQITYILAKSGEGTAAEDVCRRIEERTGLMALTRRQFMWRTMRHYLRTTGVILNFALTVFLGFLVGISMAGVSFHLFTAEHRSQFGVLKAIGLTGRRLVGMVLVQALLVGAIGYGFGVGLAALFGKLISSSSLLAFYMPYEVMIGSGLALMFIVSLVSLISIHHVLRLEPAVVLRK